MHRSSAPVSSTQLSMSCRLLRQVLDQPISPMARAAAPTLVAAMPLLREFVAGVEELADQVVLLERANLERMRVQQR